ncbi:MAG: MBL fold metallo-hydrolase [Akkermansia sp.]|nr:MBL fold metallo-hydrolase [Akkermansia sp.]
MITLTNLTAGPEIGANCYLLDMEGSRIVLDCGMHPKQDGNAAKPNFSLIGAADPDAIFITHSHLDHIGTLPVFQDEYPRAEVIMTVGTAEVGDAMLHNSVNVMTAKRMGEGIIEYPFFTHGELQRHVNAWVTRPYNEPFRTGNNGTVLATLHDAGHILGSCGVMLEGMSGTTVFYTGDVQFENQTIIGGADFPQSGVDVLIMECTHGLADRDPDYTREKEMLRFARAIREVLEAGGAVLIPVFALGKSQELLCELGRFKREGLIPDAPVYFGGLSSKITQVYDRLCDSTPRLKPGYRIKEDVETHGLPKQDKGPLVATPGNIYLVSSGMMSEHTVSYKMAAQVLPHKNDAILFVGYSDPESPAGRIKATKPGENVKLNGKGQAYPLLCRTECFDFSGHATRSALVDYACRLRPHTVVLVHGDEDAMASMQATLTDALPDSRILCPRPGKTVRLA